MAFALAGNAFAFDAFGGAGPGTHIGSAREAVAGVYGVTVAEPVVVKTMAVYGLSTYRWPVFTPGELFCEATCDIDIFYFGPLYPHAQTPEIKYGRDVSADELKDIELSALASILSMKDRSELGAYLTTRGYLFQPAAAPVSGA
jgi:hypothetical protein